MKRKNKRLTFVMIALIFVGSAVALVLTAFEENIVFFFSPTDLESKKTPTKQRFRLGGLVAKASVKKQGGGITQFQVIDATNSVLVRYKGILPDLFREGQGVVVEGRLNGSVFQADEVLAKHDENYMPPEVAEALKKSGQWKGINTTGSKAQ